MALTAEFVTAYRQQEPQNLVGEIVDVQPQLGPDGVGGLRRTGGSTFDVVTAGGNPGFPHRVSTDLPFDVADMFLESAEHAGDSLKIRDSKDWELVRADGHAAPSDMG